MKCDNKSIIFKANSNNKNNIDFAAGVTYLRYSKCK